MGNKGILYLLPCKKLVPRYLNFINEVINFSLMLIEESEFYQLLIDKLEMECFK